MEQIKLFFNSPIKYMKEYHLIVKNKSYLHEIQDENYESFEKHFPVLFDFLINFDKMFSEKLKEFLKLESYNAQFQKYIGFNHTEYKLKEDHSNLEHIEQLHKKFYFGKSELLSILENTNNEAEKDLMIPGADNINNYILEKNYNNMLFEFINSYELHHFYVSVITEKLDEFKDIDSIMKNEWDELKSKIINYTNVHTLSCLLMGSYDLFHTDKIHKHLEFEYSEHDKNILMWAFLLHDIGKYITFDSIDQEFYDYMPNDKVHPYKSGVISARMFYRNNFFKVSEKFEKESIEKDIEQLSYFLSHSNRKEKYTNDENQTRETVKQTFIYLDEIYEVFERLRLYHTDNNWIVDVLLLITFHQSLPNVDNPRFMHNPIMEDRDIKRFFKSKRLLELMRFIMINDSAGHTIFGVKVNLCPEINEKLNSLRSLFDN